MHSAQVRRELVKSYVVKALVIVAVLAMVAAMVFGPAVRQRISANTNGDGVVEQTLKDLGAGARFERVLADSKLDASPHKESSARVLEELRTFGAPEKIQDLGLYSPSGPKERRVDFRHRRYSVLYRDKEVLLSASFMLESGRYQLVGLHLLEIKGRR